MKKVLMICAMLSLSASAFGRDDDDFSGWGDNGYIDSRVTHYCWVNDENGRVLDASMFGAWLNVPKAQRKAIENCKDFRDEAYCRANVECMENSDPTDGM